MKQNLGKLTPIDVNLLKDERGRMILMDYKNHRGYLIDSNEEKKLSLFTSRYLLAVMLGVFVGFYGKWVYGVLIGVAIAAVMEYFYRSRFLPSLATIESRDLPEKKVERHVIMATRDNKSIIILLVCSIALAILLIINCFATIKQNGKPATDVDNMLLIIVSVGLCIYSAFQAVNAARALAYKKKEGK